MIDSRKNKYDIPNVVKNFVNACEEKEWKVELVKQLNTKSILNIFVDEFLTLGKFELDHSINDPYKYVNGLVQQNVDMQRKIFILEGAQKLGVRVNIDTDLITLDFGMQSYVTIDTTTWETEWCDVQEWAKTTHGILGQITKKLQELNL